MFNDKIRLNMRLTLENAAKKYPGRTVFEGISVEAEDNARLIITGPNGSGKTTLINCIGSVLTLTSGKVIFEHNNQRVTGADILPLVGLVAPDLFLYDELSALENLKFFARVSGTAGVDFENEMSRFGLDGRGDDPVGSFSSGMKQRLKYILALMKNPPLLLLDEPTANLDEAGKAMVWEAVAKHKGIVVIATNEPDEFKYGTKAIELGK